MSKIKVEKYKPEICLHCAQSTTYLLGLDKCAAMILLDLLKAISAKGVNQVHPTRELDWLSNDNKKWWATNLSVARFHGLIAYVTDQPGSYCLTKKAGKFLRGQLVPRYAIVSKAEGHQIGYWKPEEHQVTLKQLLVDSEIPFFDGAESRMIEYLDPIERSGQQTLFNNYNFVLRQERVNV